MKLLSINQVKSNIKIIFKQYNQINNKNLLTHSFSTITDSMTKNYLPASFYNTPNAAAPLIESYRSSWPDITPTANYTSTNNDQVVVPPRTVLDKYLKFEYSASFHTGTSFFYSHLDVNPSDYKVAMRVSIDDLNLSEDQLGIFLRMVGKRFNPGKREVRFTESRFPNRLENRKLLVYTLESLLSECRKLDEIKDQYLVD